MPDPDLEIRGEGEGGSHPDPETRRCRSPKSLFRLFGPQFRLTISGGGPGSQGPSLDPPLTSPHVSESKEFHAVDSGFKVLDSGFFVRETWIPDPRIP